MFLRFVLWIGTLQRFDLDLIPNYVSYHNNVTDVCQGRDYFDCGDGFCTDPCVLCDDVVDCQRSGVDEAQCPGKDYFPLR